ncbi:type II secretion system protein [Coraliomargarita parva]|uniref:type II secretion system protein n=1 Tax=Coraliomargarita parva TaxID=3014050 RepID=UPI0022B4C6CD|nr:type II secretion system protein [Coraliomargarita parva]
MRPQCRISGCSGFTLIELLAVFAVLAIVAAMMFGVVDKVRQKAYTSRCVSNLRQLVAAGKLYSNDNGGSYPPLSVGDGATKKTGLTLLRSYVEQGASGLDNSQAFEDIMICPQAWLNESDKVIPDVVTTYGLNNQLSRAIFSEHLNRPVRIGNPSSLIWMGDGRYSEKGFWARDINYTTIDLGALVHPEGHAGNYAFFDGHVETLSRDELLNESLWWPQ